MEPFQRPLTPMLATSGDLPPDSVDWAYDMKWDGVRAVAYPGGDFDMYARSGRKITGGYPELWPLADVTGGREAVLDGEIVAFDADGRVSFSALQPRINGPVRSTPPVAYLIFDLLAFDGISLLDRPYSERRRALEELGLAGPNWSTPPVFAGAGRAAVDASRAQGLEGVVAKRVDSVYRPGTRSRSWLKIKNILTQEVVIGGWRTGKDSRASTFGSLLCGVYGDDGRLAYVGRVGGGFTGDMLAHLHAELGRLARASSPFDSPDAPVPGPDTRDAHWVEPELVGEVVFAGWTTDGRLWHPRWRGLRPDLVPEQVVRET